MKNYTLSLTIAILSTSYVNALANDVSEEDGFNKKVTLTSGMTFENEKESLAKDISLLAQETGHPVNDVRNKIHFQKKFRKIANDMQKKYPEQISAVYLDKFPAPKGHIKFSGSLPKELVQKKKDLEKDNILITAGEKYSLNENQQRSVEMSNVLSKLGYENIITFFDPTQNKIQVELKIPKDKRAPRQLDLIIPLQKAFQKSALQSNLKELNENDFNLSVIIGEGKIIEEN